jgi:hypothetical protein
MRQLPESGSGLHMYDLFLLAVIAGNSHGDISPLHFYLGHDRPPASSCNFRLSASIVSHLSTAATPPLGAEASMLARFEQIFGVTWRKAISCLPPFSELRVAPYLKRAWKPNPHDLLFPNRACTRPRKRESVVQYALKPLLRKLGIDDGAGLHAFRHGLATELAEASVPITVLQTQMRHADVKTTLRVYTHIIPQSQREAMERAGMAIGTNVPIGTEVNS